MTKNIIAVTIGDINGIGIEILDTEMSPKPLDGKSGEAES